MPIKIGTDLCEVSRFADITGDKAFMERVFSPDERSYIEGKGVAASQTAAGIWCAKEAFSKTLGLGISAFALTEVEVAHDEHGAPFYRLSERLDARYNEKAFSLSISHSKECAIAVALRVIEE